MALHLAAITPVCLQWSYHSLVLSAIDKFWEFEYPNLAVEIFILNYDPGLSMCSCCLRVSFVLCYRSISQIPKCTCPIYHLMHHLEQKYAYFCSKWLYVGYGTGALWDLWYWYIREACVLCVNGKPTLVTSKGEGGGVGGILFYFRRIAHFLALQTKSPWRPKLDLLYWHPITSVESSQLI